MLLLFTPGFELVLLHIRRFFFKESFSSFLPGGSTRPRCYLPANLASWLRLTTEKKSWHPDPCSCLGVVRDTSKNYIWHMLTLVSISNMTGCFREPQFHGKLTNPSSRNIGVNLTFFVRYLKNFSYKNK